MKYGNLRRNGFSHSDVVIICICAIFLFGGLGGIGQTGRERAKIAVCQTNLKKLWEAEQNYMADHDGWFTHPWNWLYAIPILDPEPEGGFCNRWSANSCNPDGPLWPYFQNRDMIMCPTFKRIWKTNTNFALYPFASPEFEPQFSYGKNAAIGYHMGAIPIVREIDVKRLADIFLFSEENTWIVNVAYGAEYDLSSYPMNDSNLAIFDNPTDCLATYHAAPGGDLYKGSANVVFIDGHIEMITADEQYGGGTYEWARIHTGWPMYEE